MEVVGIWAPPQIYFYVLPEPAVLISGDSGCEFWLVTVKAKGEAVYAAGKWALLRCHANFTNNGARWY